MKIFWKNNRWSSPLYGLALIFDGLVILLSLGFYDGNLSFEYSYRRLKRDVERRKRLRQASTSSSPKETSLPDTPYSRNPSAGKSCLGGL